MALALAHALALALTLTLAPATEPTTAITPASPSAAIPEPILPPPLTLTPLLAPNPCLIPDHPPLLPYQILKELDGHNTEMYEWMMQTK